MKISVRRFIVALCLGLVAVPAGVVPRAQATVNSTVNKTIVLGNGVTTAFNFGFVGVASAYIAVILTDSSGNETVLAQGSGATQYQITLNAPVTGAIWGLGGTVTYNPSGTPIPAGSTLTIFRTLPLTQAISLQRMNSLSTLGNGSETGLDTVTMELQQVSEGLARAIVAPIVDATAPLPLPPIAQRANQGAAFDAAGNLVPGVMPATGVISSAMQPVVGAGSLALARTAMGLGTPACGLALGASAVASMDVNFASTAINSSQAIHAANCNAVLLATGPLTLTLDRANTLWNGFGFWVHATGTGPVTLAPNAADAIEGFSTGASALLPVGSWAWVTTDGAASGQWRVVLSTELDGGAPIVPVTGLGAKCNGIAHDELAFQAAVNVATAIGGVVQLPVGNCILNANITNAGTFISTLIKGHGETSQITFLGNFGFHFTATASYYVLQDFSVNCQTTSINACIAITNATQSTAIGSVIQRVRINQCGAIGMQFQNLVQASLLDNVILSTGIGANAALYIDNSQTADVGPNIIRGNNIITVSGSTVFGIYLLNVGGTQTLNNNVGGYSYDIYSDNNLASGAATGMLIQGNQLDNFTIGGIYLNSAGAGGSIGHVAINNNTMHANQIPAAIGSLGIAFAEAPGSVGWSFNSTITGNVIDTFSGSGGILLGGARIISITGNSIFDEGTPTGAGIKANASTSTCTIVGNVVGTYATHVTNTAGCTTAGNN